MSKLFYGSATVLFVRDLNRSLDFYCNKLGFNRPKLWGDPPGFAMPSREDMTLMLSQVDDEKSIIPKKTIWDVYYWVVDAAALYREFMAKGVTFGEELTHKELYNNLEFTVKDPDGHEIAFGQELGEVENSSKKTGQESVTKIHFISPVLASSDVRRDIEFYEDKLGFKNVYDSTNYSDGPVDYAVLRRQQAVLHLQFQFPDDMISTDVKFEVENIFPIYQEYLKNEVITESAFHAETQWKTREFTFFDLSRNRLTFFEDL